MVSTRLNKFEHKEFEDTAGQFAISAGLLISLKLEKDALHKYESVLREKPDGLEMRHLHMLNWIALFFAQTGNDSTAVAVSKENDGLGFHISINRKTLDENTRSRTTSFVSCVYKAMMQKKATTEPQKLSHHHVVLRCMVENSWPAIRQRLEHLNTAINNTGGVDSLIAIWQGLDHRVATKKSAAEEIKSHIREHLISLSTLTIPTDSNGDTESHLRCLLTALNSCHGLLAYQSVPKPDDKSWYATLDHNTYHNLDKIFRCFNSVYEYQTGSIEFAFEGIEFIRKHLGSPANEAELQKHLHVLWVRDHVHQSLESQCHWDKSPEEYVGEILDTYEKYDSVICRPENDKHKLSLLDRCKALWTKASQITAMVHPEVELLYYLQEKKVEPLFTVIGTDSELCFVCGLYFDQVHKHMHTYWLTRSGSPNKAQQDWLLPPVVEAHNVGKKKWASMSAAAAGASVRWRAVEAIEAYLAKTRTTPPEPRITLEELTAEPELDVDFHKFGSYTEMAVRARKRE